jgi:hypothetical protein
MAKNEGNPFQSGLAAPILQLFHSSMKLQHSSESHRVMKLQFLNLNNDEQLLRSISVQRTDGQKNRSGGTKGVSL